MDPDEISLEEDEIISMPDLPPPPLLSTEPILSPEEIRQMMGFNAKPGKGFGSSEQMKPCFAWQNKGKCTNGNLCQYSHDRPATGHTTSTGNNDTSNNANPCHAFQRGQCFRGNACRYSHQHAQGGTSNARNTSNTSNTRNNRNSNAGSRNVLPKEPMRTCFAWQKNECSRGDSCRFSHIGNGSNGSSNGTDTRSRAPPLISPGCLDDPWSNLSGRTMAEAQQYQMSLMPMLMSGGGNNKRGRDGGGRGRRGNNRGGGGGGGRGRWQRRPQRR